jgi:DNA-binding CsgD family transcriptional regulator
MSNREISEQLLISQRTANTHQQNIMKKLDVKKVVGLIKFAIKNGLVD